MKKTAEIALAAYIAPFAAWADYPEMAVSFVVPFPTGDIAATNPLVLALVHRAPVGVVGIANGTDHGLASAVWTENQSRAHRMIRAMQIMAKGAALLSARLHQKGEFDGVLVLGGSMGTDLALDLCSALPIGVPKYIVSTVSFSPMIPPERLPADIQMILWAGGLYGLNSVCEASLAQAAGAVLGAARAARPIRRDRPLIGMTSFGKTVLRYMVHLKRVLEARGFELAVFHATGMGGRAFESLASKGEFAAVLDFAPQEVGNHLMGSAISAGDDRMTNAGKAGVPQIVSIGCYDLVDLVGWHPIPPKLADQELHAHNRLITAVSMNCEQRREMARAMCEKLATANGPTVFLLPLQGGNEWDRKGGLLEDAEGLAAFIEEIRACCPKNVTLVELDAHINDVEFSEKTLEILDAWSVLGVTVNQ